MNDPRDMRVMEFEVRFVDAPLEPGRARKVGSQAASAAQDELVGIVIAQAEEVFEKHGLRYAGIGYGHRIRR